MAQDPVTGRHRPPAPSHQHWDGWNAAVEHALANTNWPANTYADVTVEFFATVKVTNPGSIVEYAVRITPGR